MANKYWIGLATPGDYSVAGNWSPSGVPTAGDVVYIPAGSPSITAGLNQSAVALDGFFVEPGYSGQIGSGTANLQITLDTGEPFVFAGSNTAYIDLGSSATTATVNNTGLVTGGGYGLYLLGTALTVLTVNKGVVGFAARGEDASTAAVVNVNWITSQPTDATLVCGSGVTLTDVNQTGGNLTIQSAATTVSVLSGTCFILGTGAVTTLTNNGGTVYPSATGTITTVAANSGTTDFTRSLSARTVTTMTSAGQNAVIIYDESFLTITNKLNVADVPMRIEVRGLNA
jgi:hypothetical protein